MMLSLGSKCSLKLGTIDVPLLTDISVMSCVEKCILRVIVDPVLRQKPSIYTLSDLGDLSNLIGSLSRTIQQYSPPSEWIMCELGVFPIF